MATQVDVGHLWVIEAKDGLSSCQQIPQSPFQCLQNFSQQTVLPSSLCFHSLLRTQVLHYVPASLHLRAGFDSDNLAAYPL